MIETGSLVGGKYKILSKIGQGGMSIVYLAEDKETHRRWAIKEIRRDGIFDCRAVEQSLLAEAEKLKKLRHPSLPGILDIIEEAHNILIVMDYIEGSTLGRIVREKGAQPQEKVVEWAKQLCDVLGYLHSQTPVIIYRDMKPANIMLKSDGSVALIDFGTAREFKAQKPEDTAYLGTIGYASPEQFGGRGQTDVRTDIYCMGVTLYHLVTGQNPCEPPYVIKPIRSIVPELSGGLEHIILKCTNKDPDRRYQSSEELMHDLNTLDKEVTEFGQQEKRNIIVEAEAEIPDRRKTEMRFLAAVFIAVILGIIFQELFFPA